MAKKIIITAGGTGGHIFPAIALGAQLVQSSSLEVLFVGGNLSNNPYFDKEAFTFKTVSCATFKSKNPWAILKTITKISLGICESCKILDDFQPDLVVGFGSYYTLPLLIAAKMKNIPFILHEANSIPGKVNRLLAKYAIAVGLQFPETAGLLKGKMHEVGLPLRPGYRLGATSGTLARAYFELEENRITILIFGGSQGAAKLNHLVSQALIEHFTDQKDHIQLIHFTGDAGFAQQLRSEYGKLGFKSCVKAFEPRMDLAWQAADISIARAGAATIAEQMEFEVPGILVPYPYATDHHQDKNADFLVNTVRGAVKLQEAYLTPELLSVELKSLFDSERRKKMRFCMQKYKTKNRPKNLCELVLEHILFQVQKPPFGLN